MRGLPFFKPKKGVQFAGEGFEDSSGGGGGSSYTLPTATESRLGGVKVGSGLAITEDGVLSSSGGGGGSSLDLDVGENIIGTIDNYDIVCKVVKNTNGSRSSGAAYVENFTHVPVFPISLTVVYNSSVWGYSKKYDSSTNGSYITFDVSNSYSYDVEYVICTYLSEHTS